MLYGLRLLQKKMKRNCVKYDCDFALMEVYANS